MNTLSVTLLGGFRVDVDGEAVPPEGLRGRARDLVKLLALTPSHRLSRDAAVEALWPQLDPEAGYQNLHKAAHYARRALGDSGAVVLREGQVALAPDAEVKTDVERFEAEGDPDLYGGELLPDDAYAAWAQARRAELAERYRAALHGSARWEQLAADDPADERAQQAVMRARFAAGDRSGALAAFDRLREAQLSLGLEPGMETIVLHGRIAGGAALNKALASVEEALSDAPVADRTDLLATRADLLLSIGDRGAPAAYAEAARAAGPASTALRIGQARAHIALGEPGAALATLGPLEPASDPERVAHLITEAAAAWFSGDVDRARQAAAEGERLAREAGLKPETAHAIQVQMMVAHSAGEWPDALRGTLRESLGTPGLADTLFDGHLCVAEYALTSGESHEGMRELGEEIHAHSVRSGARRAQAFAATLLGEIFLISAETDHADQKLREAVKLSREIGAEAAEALALMRLGEAVRAVGDEEEAERLLADALVISRWSPLSHHLLRLVYAVVLRGTEDPALAGERLAEAEAQLRSVPGACRYCSLIFNVSAAIAAARSGDPERAQSALSAAEADADLWTGGPWPAAFEEARGEVALARAEQPEAVRRLSSARERFASEGWRLDAERVAKRLAAVS